MPKHCCCTTDELFSHYTVHLHICNMSLHVESWTLVELYNFLLIRMNLKLNRTSYDCWVWTIANHDFKNKKRSQKDKWMNFTLHDMELRILQNDLSAHLLIGCYKSLRSSFHVLPHTTNIVTKGNRARNKVFTLWLCIVTFLHYAVTGMSQKFSLFKQTKFSIWFIMDCKLGDAVTSHPCKLLDALKLYKHARKCSKSTVTNKKYFDVNLEWDYFCTPPFTRNPPTHKKYYRNSYQRR